MPFCPFNNLFPVCAGLVSPSQVNPMGHVRFSHLDILISHTWFMERYNPGFHFFPHEHLWYIPIKLALPWQSQTGSNYAIFVVSGHLWTFPLVLNLRISCIQFLRLPVGVIPSFLGACCIGVGPDPFGPIPKSGLSNFGCSDLVSVFFSESKIWRGMGESLISCGREFHNLSTATIDTLSYPLTKAAILRRFLLPIFKTKQAQRREGVLQVSWCQTV